MTHHVGSTATKRNFQITPKNLRARRASLPSLLSLCLASIKILLGNQRHFHRFLAIGCQFEGRRCF
jgi:hypothetical protein